MSGTAASTENSSGLAGTGIAVLAKVFPDELGKVAFPPPPETFGGYQLFACCSQAGCCQSFAIDNKRRGAGC